MRTKQVHNAITYVATALLIVATLTSGQKQIEDDAPSLSEDADTGQIGNEVLDDTVETIQDTTTTIKTTTAADIIRPKFKVSRHPEYPWTILRVDYSPEASATNYFMHYRVNFTDLSAVGQSPPGSYLLTGTNPFDLHQLNAGHEYAITIVGIPLDQTHDTQMLFSDTYMTAPKAPDFIGQNSVTSTTRTIMLKGQKPGGALQDTFTIRYSQIDPPLTFEPRVINDIAEQKQVELFLNNLTPGHQYNVTVTADKKRLSSRPWSMIITTKPLPPMNVHIADLQANSITLQWDEPGESGVGFYRVMYNENDQSQSAAPQVKESRDAKIVIDGLRPGLLYKFNVFALVDSQSSEATSFYANTRPLGASSLQLRPRIDLQTFQVELTPVSLIDSQSDHCQLTVIHETTTLDKNYSLPLTDNMQICTFNITLEAGDRYVFYGRMVSNGTESAALENITVVRPAFDMDAFGLDIGLADEPVDDTIRLSYSHSANRLGMRDLWEKVVGRDSIIKVKVAAEDKQWEQNWTPLDASATLPLDMPSLPLGQCYQVTVYTVTSSGVLSANRSNLSIRTRGPAANVSLLEAHQTDVELTVQSTADTPWCSLVIKLMLNGQQNDVINENETDVTTKPTKLTIKDLTAYTDYLLTSEVRCNKDERCAPATRNIFPVTFTTDEGSPSSIRQLSAMADKPYQATLTWQPPMKPNGRIIEYQVKIDADPTNPRPEASWNVTTMAEELNARLSNLTGGNTYIFHVRARTSAGFGPSVAKQLQMPIWAPPPPDAKPDILQSTLHATQMTIKFNTNMFSELHGAISKYETIVEQVDEQRGPASVVGADVMTWSQVQSFPIWPAYVALSTTYKPDFVDTQVLGADPDCTTSKGICNGYLQPGKSYRIKLRVYTTEQHFTDSQWSQTVTTELDTSAQSLIIVAVLLCILFVATVALCIILALKHSNCAKLRKIVMKGLNRSDSLDGTDSSSHKHSQNGVIGDSQLMVPTHRRTRSLRERTGVALGLGSAIRHGLPPTVQIDANTHVSRPVPKSKFKEHVALMSADSDFKFSEEYEELKQVGRGQACLAADLVCNRVKNRFTNILPYDHSRVKLIPVDDEDGSDYINANYIPGHNSPREFIAAQGPLAATRDDFWRMVWEQHCPAVINLTKCIEKGRDKCYKYWPDNNETNKYWDLEVTLKNESVHEEWVIREFVIFNLEEPGSSQRSIYHLHYLGWPDFGVPDKPQSLVQFVRSFRHRVPPSKACKPTVVHCSAGVGRSGTFITLDRTLQQFAEGSQIVDIYAIVHEMRMHRVCMVQTEQQYICIHQCVLCVIESRENGIQQYPKPVGLPQIHCNTLRQTQSDTNVLPKSSQPALVHQNPAFEDDEGIAESGL